MADVFLFIRHGWENIWKQKTVWLFSALVILNQLFNVFQTKRPTELFPSLIFLVTSCFLLILYYVGYIGVRYLVYCSLIGEPATIQETLFAVRKFFGRVLGCSCIVLLAA